MQVEKALKAAKAKYHGAMDLLQRLSEEITETRAKRKAEKMMAEEKEKEAKLLADIAAAEERAAAEQRAAAEERAAAEAADAARAAAEAAEGAVAACAAAEAATAERAAAEAADAERIAAVPAAAPASDPAASLRTDEAAEARFDFSDPGDQRAAAAVSEQTGTAGGPTAATTGAEVAASSAPAGAAHVTALAEAISLGGTEASADQQAAIEKQRIANELADLC